MIALRTASEHDISMLYQIDEQSVHDSRRNFICRTVNSKACHIILIDEEVVAYGVMENTFYEHGLISMIVVSSKHRRQGYGAALLRYLARLAPTNKLFTSINLSITPMQTLLLKEGFTASELIYNLDEDDPELVYFKKVP